MLDLPLAPPLPKDSYSSSHSIYNTRQPSTTTAMFTSELASSSKRYASSDRVGDLHDPVRQTKQQRRLSPTSSLYPTTMASRPRWEVTDEYALADEDDEQEIVSYANYWEDRWGQQTRSKPRPHSMSSYNYNNTSSATASTSQHRHAFNYWGCSSHSPESDNTVLSDTEDYEYDDDATTATKKRRVSRIFSRAVRRQRHASDPVVGTTYSTAVEAAQPTSAQSAPPIITINNDPFLDSYPHHPLTPSRSARSRASRRSQDGAYSLPSSPMHRPSSLLEQEEDDDHFQRTPTHVEEDEEEEEKQQEYVPTCSDAIRRQWQAIALRVQFGLFRAQKRFKGRSARVKTRLGLTSQSS